MQLPCYHLNDCDSDEAISELTGSEKFDFRFDCGYTKAKITLQDKEEMIKTIALLYHVHGEISQLQMGIKETLNFGHLMEVSTFEMVGECTQ